MQILVFIETVAILFLIVLIQTIRLSFFMAAYQKLYKEYADVLDEYIRDCKTWKAFMEENFTEELKKAGVLDGQETIGNKKI